MSYDDVDLPSEWVTNTEIDKLLQEYRPDRYCNEDDEWLRLIEDEISDRIPPAEAKTIAARTELATSALKSGSMTLMVTYRNGT